MILGQGSPVLSALKCPELAIEIIQFALKDPVLQIFNQNTLETCQFLNTCTVFCIYTKVRELKHSKNAGLGFKYWRYVYRALGEKIVSQSMLIVTAASVLQGVKQMLSYLLST